MEFDLNADERALRDAAREFLAAKAPVSYARSVIESPVKHHDDIWRQTADLGWMALPFAEEHGGLGQGFIALSILLAEMGRVVLPGPYLSTVGLAGVAISAFGTEMQRKEILPAVCDGSLFLALAADETDEAGAADDATVHAVADGPGWQLEGEKRFVLGGIEAERIVVAARAPDGPALFITGRDGIAATATDVLDATRSFAHLSFDHAPAARMISGGAAVTSMLDRAAVALSAEMLGTAERALEIAVEYAQQRVQFGREIGSFQAVKHRAADMLIDVESARNAVWYASWAIDRDHPDASLAASTAKAVVSDCARRVTQGCIQIHGGIGFTWEHDAHLYFKRIKVAEAMLGDATWHRERGAALLAARYAGS